MPALLCGSWKASFRFRACIGTMNPHLTPPRRGTDRTRTNACSPPGRGRGWVGSWKGSAGFTTSTALQRVKQMMQKQDVVALHVLHRPAHARITLAETEVIRRIVLGRLPFGPIPVATLLQIDHVNGLVFDDGPAGLQSQIVHAAQTLFKDLWAHDGRADGKHHASVQPFDRRAEQAKIDLRCAPDGRAVE